MYMFPNEHGSGAKNSYSHGSIGFGNGINYNHGYGGDHGEYYGAGFGDGIEHGDCDGSGYGYGFEYGCAAGDGFGDGVGGYPVTLLMDNSYV